MRFSHISLITALSLLSSGLAHAAPIPIRVVIVTTFEIGHDTGDTPGEFQTWVEKLPLQQEIKAPGTDHGLMRYNPDLHVLGVVTGEGPEHMASAMTALALDPRFDLRKSYFVLAGIAGINPRFGTLGSAVWAPQVVNGGLAHLIDPREIPADWPDGYTPVQGSTPDEKPVPPLHSLSGDMVYTLNPELTAWAVHLTKSVVLQNTPEMMAVRARYTGFPEAMKPPVVTSGATLSSETFWVGARMNDWAERWVSYWTKGQGRFATTAEEDVGYMQALTAQAKAGRIDASRILLLRTASNFDMPHPGQTAANLLNDEAHGKGYAGFLPSVDAAWRVGSVVVKELALNWDKYADNTPHAPAD
ncbi:MAG: purine nucleoside permease [Acetobacter sp.]|jgi:purine nucleoside permease|nr:purine nucleoside permease [Acetobacter sp.]MCH4060145.1 purine nucleoside permease [Acetobacter sp.]MCH4087085.1 purine nucleoside permease [Acetobacter sp.]MCI1292905.1 purine nucleoside permease [Acetobacter sp.]MCI1319491.1 purine nucleoside permease [Acetobacter sp.]